MKNKIINKIKSKFELISKLNDLFDSSERWQFLLVLISALAMAFFQAIGIFSILPFINIAMNPSTIHENYWLNYIYIFFNFNSTNSFLIFFGFVVLGILIIGNSISSFAIWLRISFVWKKNHKLSVMLLKKYLSMPYVYFLNKNTSELGKNILAEVQQLANSFFLPLLSIFTNIVIVIVIFSLLLYVNLKMTLGAVIILSSFYFFVYFYYSDKLRIGGIKRVEENKGRFKFSTEALEGIKDIKILGAEEFFLNKFQASSDRFSKLQSWYQTVGQIPRYIMEVIAFGGIVSLLIFLVYSNIPMQEIIPLISFFAFAGYRLIPSLQDIFNSFTIIRFNKAVLDKIHEDAIKNKLVKKDILLENKNSEIKPLNFNNKISLENIYFSYPENDNLLKNINIEIKKGSFVAIIGATGSGKTTLVDLILGLFIPNKGRIMIDDIGINENNAKNWQVNIGYVPQQIYLSDDSILGNIAFGIPEKEINMDQVRKVSKMACLDDFIINELPKGYRTNIGERGIRLSGGQRQRIGIARALYNDPEVLILDEATSSLDNKTEKEVLNAIEDIAKSKTMIIIAHRLTTVKNCNVVYVMQKGKIIDKGTYEEMVEGKL